MDSAAAVAVAAVVVEVSTAAADEAEMLTPRLGQAIGPVTSVEIATSDSVLVSSLFSVMFIR